MGKIKVETCEIEGLKVITPTVFGDERGYFMETYNYNDYKELIWNLCRIISHLPKKEYLEGFIFRSIIHRIN